MRLGQGRAHMLPLRNQPGVPRSLSLYSRTTMLLLYALIFVSLLLLIFLSLLLCHSVKRFVPNQRSYYRSPRAERAKTAIALKHTTGGYICSNSRKCIYWFHSAARHYPCGLYSRLCRHSWSFKSVGTGCWSYPNPGNESGGRKCRYVKHWIGLVSILESVS